ncbi:hypothetical protein HanRHA438_Chr02g0054411 [Helianthus annuus]|nr:hypothetical protein HanRHA438_Chr02g0054411 [Helianthus annuus]
MGTQIHRQRVISFLFDVYICFYNLRLFVLCMCKLRMRRLHMCVGARGLKVKWY